MCQIENVESCVTDVTDVTNVTDVTWQHREHTACHNFVVFESSKTTRKGVYQVGRVPARRGTDGLPSFTP
jgi:hypothetical protein